MLATHPLLTIALLETMKRFGRFPLHAAGLSLNGGGVLVPGSSGAGKSTLSVTLVRAGFDFLSDDTVFLSPRPTASGCPDFPTRWMSPTTRCRWSPSSAIWPSAPMPPGPRQARLPGRGRVRHHPVLACRPAVLLSPRVEPGARPALEPLAPAEALFELMPNVLLTDQVATQAHLDVLAELVESSPASPSGSGRDLDAAAACVAELVA